MNIRPSNYRRYGYATAYNDPNNIWNTFYTDLAVSNVIAN